MKNLFVIIFLFLLGCIAPKYALKNNEQATVTTVFEKYRIDSLTYYYFAKQNSIIIKNKKYCLTGWIADETPYDSTFKNDILNEYSAIIYNKIIAPEFKYSLASEIDNLDTLPYLYKRSNQHGQTGDNFLFMIYTVQGDFFTINKKDKNIIGRLTTNRRFCPIQEDKPMPPFCIMIECDTVCGYPDYLLDKKKLKRFSLPKNKINHCD